MEITRVREKSPLLSARRSRRERTESCRLPSEKTIAVVIILLFIFVVLMIMVTYKIRTRSDTSLHNSGSMQESFIRFPDYDNFTEFWSKGEKLAKKREKLELRLAQTGIVPPKDSASSHFQKFLKLHISKKVMRCAIISEYVKRKTGTCVNASLLPVDCQNVAPARCDPSYTYRTFDGSCNNLRHPTWGMSETPFGRLLQASYDDGVSSPRKSVFGGELPSPRLISSSLYSRKSMPDSSLTLLAMCFALFLDHDFATTATQSGSNGTPITCCDSRVLQKPSLKHPECMEIDVPTFDSFYGPLNISCMDFVRSAPICGNCPGRREQVNLATSYIDGSAIYGTSLAAVKSLRSFKHGQLLDSVICNTSVLPISHTSQCFAGKGLLPCFSAGDNRVNENAGLLAMHILWFREHNRIAEELYRLNPSWTDETIFQETRKIVAAEIAHITYEELLPVLLGQEAINRLGLQIESDKLFDRYNPRTDSSIFNVFGAAAFRMGHTLVQDMVKLYSSSKLLTSIPLHETFQNPNIVYHGMLDDLLRGMIIQNTHSVDTYISPEIRNLLFKPPKAHAGLDLAAYSIQRCRDHGIPGYTAWRDLCDLPKVDDFKDLYKYMPKEHVERITNIYKSIHDIDLIPAAIAEYHVEGAMLGPTYVCLIGRQFQHLREGDRFWFEIPNENWSFTNDQLNEIYKSNMARITCDNSDGLDKIQKHALRSISKSNPLLPCDELPKIDLSKWTD